MTRTERWYALVALIYVTAHELSRRGTDTSGWGHWFKITPGRTTGRTITAKVLKLAPNTVTNALTKAQEQELFTRQYGRTPPLRNRPPNRPGGRLTKAGWKALGPVTSEWRHQIGSSWKNAENPWAEVAVGEDARKALLILAEELWREEARASKRAR